MLYMGVRISHLCVLGVAVGGSMSGTKCFSTMLSKRIESLDATIMDSV